MNLRTPLLRQGYFMNLLKIGILIWIGGLLVGCSSILNRQDPAPVYGKDGSTRHENKTGSDRGAEQTAEIKVVPGSVILRRREFATPVKQKSSPVVVALLDKADVSYQQGKFGKSVATIEQALRIEPRNALLLYKLAALRLQQGQPELAENLAKKSELLAEGNASLKKKNWLLIAAARARMENFAGAKAARKQASRF